MSMVNLEIDASGLSDAITRAVESAIPHDMFLAAIGAAVHGRWTQLAGEELHTSRDLYIKALKPPVVDGDTVTVAFDPPRNKDGAMLDAVENGVPADWIAKALGSGKTFQTKKGERAMYIRFPQALGPGGSDSDADGTHVRTLTESSRWRLPPGKHLMDKVADELDALISAVISDFLPGGR